MDDIALEAISSALSGNWQRAHELNEAILKDSPDNVDAMVRLAKAQIELGQSEKAKKTLEKVLKLDPLNSIAGKTIQKLKSAKIGGEVTHSKANSQMFLEEAGKTRLVELTHLGDPNVILQLDPGDEVKLISGGHGVSVNTLNDKHLGRLPDYIGFRLRNLITDGFAYQALIKSGAADSVKIFVREISKPAKFEKIISFPIEKTYPEEQVRAEEAEEKEDEEL